jgi:hypothetical protein
MNGMHRGDSVTLNDDKFPLLLPHYSVEVDGLFCGSRKVADLTPSERALCLRADGMTPAREIPREPGVSPGHGVTSRMVELRRALAVAGPGPAAPGGTILLSLDAYSALLAAGGSAAAGQLGDVTHVVCFARSGATVRPDVFSTVGEITAVQRDEANIASAVAGCRNRFINLHANSLREGLRKAGHPIEDLAVAAALRGMIFDLIATLSPRRIVVPAALGGTPDAMMVQRIILDFFKQSLFPDVEYLFYECWPSGREYVWSDYFVDQIETKFCQVEEVYFDIKGHIRTKQDLHRVFYSSIQRADLALVRHLARRNLVSAGAEASDPDAGLERFFKLTDFAD